MKNKKWKILIIIFALIILLIYSEAIMSFGKKILYRQQGYVICNDVKCMNEHLQLCQKAYWNDYGGNLWVETFIKGYDKGDCVYVILRSNSKKTVCRFSEEIFSKELVDEVFGVHHGLHDVIKENCEHINIK